MSPILTTQSQNEPSPVAELDQVTAAVMRAKFDALLGEMSVTLQNSSRSRRISVLRLFGCALLDVDGEVVAADNPRHLSTIRATARACIEKYAFDLAVDDVLVANDPYLGGISVHYTTLVAPFGVGEDIHGYLAVQAHMPDVGGLTMGNYDASVVEMRAEGMRYTPLRLARYGRVRRDLLDTILMNGREPEAFRHDLEAMLATLGVGRRRTGELLSDYGIERVNIGFASVLDYSERRMRHGLQVLPDGAYSAECMLDGDFQGREDLTVRVTLEKTGDRLVVDFTETDGQSAGFVNSTHANTEAYALLPLLSLLDDSVPRNGGLLRALDVRTREGTLTHVRKPAPTGLSTEHVGYEIAEAVRRALSAASSELTAPGLPSRLLAFTVRKEQRIGHVIEQLGMTDLAVFSQAGVSAAAGVDGWGQPGPVSLGLMPSVEEMELEHELSFRRLEYRCDSAGAGRHRGGLGTETVIAIPEGSPERFYACVPATEHPPAGLDGGKAGEAASVLLRSGGREAQVHGVTADLVLGQGAELVLRTPGGGGFGDPSARSAAEVQADVEDGYISATAATELYGAVLEDQGAAAPSYAGSDAR